MKRKKMRKLMMELSRRIYLNHYGTLKGFGKVSKFYDDKWRPDFAKTNDKSYDSIWNCNALVQLRKSVGM